MARAVEASEDLLEQLVHQFSDPLAFYRELIQNSIDAGSSRIEVSLRYTPGARGARGVAQAQVADWGEGMTRQIIERFLLTKFRSSKEDDLTKIGKFGIGFMSVFAPGPQLVVVDTSRDGEDWRLIFAADRSYQLFKCPEPVEGTRVALYREMEPAAYLDFARASGEAVRRWCRHSEVEVTFAAGGEDGSPPPAPEPVREGFHVDALLEVELREEGTCVVAGLARRRPPLCGFYNRGLTLLEVSEELVPGVTFKIASRWLEHTLTRDDVRRDRNFGKAMALVKRLVEGPLRERVRTELKAAAARPDSPEYALLLTFAAKSLDRDELWFPLAGGGAVDGAALRKACRKLPALTASLRPDPLVASLTAQGIPVLLGEGIAPVAASQALEKPVAIAQETFVLAVEEQGEDEQRLARALRRVLPEAGLVPKRLVVARLHGAEHKQLYCLVDEPGRAEPARKMVSPFKEGARAVLCFNTSDPRVASAVRLARQSPHLAALLCARLLAVSWGALGEKADRRMTEAALLEGEDAP